MRYIELLDWRRRVATLYAELRLKPPTADTAGWFRAQKDALFRDHPQSPISESQRTRFEGLDYWVFDPLARVSTLFTPIENGGQFQSGEAMLDLIGILTFELQEKPCSLGAYWVRGYAGGLFVPFRDGTSLSESYGGGRYALDTIKSADLGVSESGAIVLDFNYAYNPSCAYDPQWACPLAPPSNRLDIAIRAGERMMNDGRVTT